jgi:hypothetical protein
MGLRMWVWLEKVFEFTGYEFAICFQVCCWDVFLV